MKSIGFIAILFWVISLVSCSEECTCYRYCLQYNNDSVQICRGFLYEANFLHAADSLTAQYGPATDTIQPPSQTLTGGSVRTGNFVRNWEQKGYYCICAK